jgi:hypothetical protein
MVGCRYRFPKIFVVRAIDPPNVAAGPEPQFARSIGRITTVFSAGYPRQVHALRIPLVVYVAAMGGAAYVDHHAEVT